MKCRGVILTALALVSLACSKTVTHKEAEFRSDTSCERHTMQFSDEKSGSRSTFEIPAGEERLIQDMARLLQEKMAKDYPAGQVKRDAHPKNLACLQAEIIVEPNIPAALKMGIFASPAAYPAWIRISSASDKIQSDKIKDVRGFAIKIMGSKGSGFSCRTKRKRPRISS